MRDLGIPQGQLEQLEQEVLGKGRRRGSSGRQPLPKALPRERIEHALPEQERCCTACGVELTKIREEVTEQLDYTPASFKIIEHVRGVFACKSCEETMVRAPKPAQAIEKGLPGPGLLAQVVVGKYATATASTGKHCQSAHGRHGVTLSRSTLRLDCRDSRAGPVPSSTGCGAICCDRASFKPTTHRSRCSTTRAERTKASSGLPRRPRASAHRLRLHADPRGADRLDSWVEFRGYLQADAYSG